MIRFVSFIGAPQGALKGHKAPAVNLPGAFIFGSNPARSYGLPLVWSAAARASADTRARVDSTSDQLTGNGQIGSAGGMSSVRGMMATGAPSAGTKGTVPCMPGDPLRGVVASGVEPAFPRMTGKPSLPVPMITVFEFEDCAS